MLCQIKKCVSSKDIPGRNSSAGKEGKEKVLKSYSRPHLNSLSIYNILSLNILLIEVSDPLLSVYFMFLTTLWNPMTNAPFLLQLQCSGIHFV